MRKTRKFWLVAGGIVLLGFLGVIVGSDYYVSSRELRQQNTPGKPELAVLGSRYRATWTDIPVSEFSKPAWRGKVWWTVQSVGAAGKTTKSITQSLCTLYVPPVVEGGVKLHLEFEARGELSADVTEYRIDFLQDLRGTMGRSRGMPGGVAKGNFDPQTKILRVQIAWAFPQQKTGKTCELAYRLTPEGFVLFADGAPNAAPAGAAGP